MRTPFRDLPRLLSTPEGRRRLRFGLSYIAFPVTKHVARLYRRTALRRTRMIAVVGSLGKTTTRRILAAALQDSDRRLWGLPVVRSILELRPGRAHAVFELGIDAPGQMAPLVWTLRPDIVVVTTIGSDHHRSLKTLENTRHEKAMAVRALSPKGVAILNGDDPNVMWMAGQTKAEVLTYGLGGSNDVRATDIELEWPRGLAFVVHARGISCKVRTNFMGTHFVYLFLAAAAVAVREGMAIEEFAERVKGVSPGEGRMTVHRLANGAVLLCDYFKSSLESMHAALDTLESVPAKRRWVVFGDVDDPPASPGTVYGPLGERIAQVADRAVFVGGNFRRYRAGARRAGMSEEPLMDAQDAVLRAAEIAASEIGDGDVVLIKGRSEQRLDRVALALEGKTVGCTIVSCKLKNPCRTCSKLERGWDVNAAAL